MSRIVSMSVRAAEDAEFRQIVETALLVIEHPDLPKPFLVSSDNAVLFSRNPYVRGTLSRWRSEDGKPARFLFVSIAVVVPDESEAVPSNGSLIVDVRDTEICDLLFASCEPATIHLAIVQSNTPDVIEHEIPDVPVLTAETDYGIIKLTFGEEDYLNESVPVDRTTRQKFPGLNP